MERAWLYQGEQFQELVKHSATEINCIIKLYHSL